MRQSALFTKTRFEAPKDEVANNAKLLIRAGYIHKEMAGVYSLLPLGLRVLNKINAIIRQEMDGLGASEVSLSSMQSPEIWQKTDRWDDKKIDIWFKTALKNKSELGLGFTHEEPLTALMLAHINSYRDLPRAVYQIQTKFRNETRAKSGILRGREFLMKDLYSFHQNQEDLDLFYDRVIEAYRRIFASVGLGDRTYLTFASGGAFSKYSHEFQTICEAGEDTIYLSADKNLAVNLEVCTEEVLKDLELEKGELIPHKAIEVGNIFKLGTRFSTPLGLDFVDESGRKKPVIMASYGLGPTRLLGTVAEVLSDERGLVWPKAIAPFDIHLVELSSKDPAIRTTAEDIYRQFSDAGLEVLYDDRDLKAGEKFVDSDLIGLPARVVISERTWSEKKLEYKERRNGDSRLLEPASLLNQLIGNAK